MGAALLLPNTLSLLNHSYQDPVAKAKAVATLACLTHVLIEGRALASPSGDGR